MFWFDFYQDEQSLERKISASGFAWAGESPLGYLNSFQRASKICIVTDDKGNSRRFEQSLGEGWFQVEPPD
jgi:hypothetical protein